MTGVVIVECRRFAGLKTRYDLPTCRQLPIKIGYRSTSPAMCWLKVTHCMTVTIVLFFHFHTATDTYWRL